MNAIHRLLTAALASCTLFATAATASPASRIGHVFVIVLENKSESGTFGSNSPAPYLSKTLPTLGAFVPNYYGIGHLSNPNYLAMISGQAPNVLTQTDCQVYAEFQGTGTLAAFNGQALGQGCVFPKSVPTVANQLSSRGLLWKGYMEDMGNDAGREAATCGHPKLNSQDHTQTATSTDSYATRHDPFVYFHSIIDSPSCDANVVSLTPFAQDLKSVATTPNLSFIVPSLCHDGHDSPCANGEAGGLVSADAFLSRIVPEILQSQAFQQDGLLIITFDESDGATADSTGCCGEHVGLNTVLPGLTGTGGGKVGAVLLSPFITPGTVSTESYNHYSLLRSIEDAFGLSYIGFAGARGVLSFGSDICNGGKDCASPN